MGFRAADISLKYVKDVDSKSFPPEEIKGSIQGKQGQFICMK